MASNNRPSSGRWSSHHPINTTAVSRANLQDPQDPLNLHAQQVRNLAEEYGIGPVDSLQLLQNFADKDGTLQDLLSQSNHLSRKGQE